MLKQATASIPIVFALAVDPIGAGLVASLSRPGGNVTGMSLQTREIGGKRLELFREIVSRLRRLAIIFDRGYVGWCRRAAMFRQLRESSGSKLHRMTSGKRKICVRFRCAQRSNGRTLRRRKRSDGEQRALIVALALKTQLPSTFATAIPREPGPLTLTDRTSRLFSRRRRACRQDTAGHQRRRLAG